jgi:sialate O-acetylesterase
MKIHCIFLKWSLLLFVMSIPLNASCIPPRNNHTEKIEVACVGNSVTKGYGLHSPEKDAYPSQLQRFLGKNYEVRNFGHNGATLLTKGHRPYVETQEYRDALNFKANILSDKLSLSLIHRNVFTKMETIENQLQ